MKVASMIFVILGMILNWLYYPTVLAVIGLIIGIIMISTLCANKKSIFIGIVGLLFTSLLGGIFYLCWNVEETNNES